MEATWANTQQCLFHAGSNLSTSVHAMPSSEPALLFLKNPMYPISYTSNSPSADPSLNSRNGGMLRRQRKMKSNPDAAISQLCGFGHITTFLILVSPLYNGLDNKYLPGLLGTLGATTDEKSRVEVPASF